MGCEFQVFLLGNILQLKMNLLLFRVLYGIIKLKLVIMFHKVVIRLY